MTSRARLATNLAAALLGVLGTAGVVLALAERPDRPRIAPREPLRSPLLGVQDCQSCHPRQAAEWRRSVMAYSVRSPLFQALEMAIQEQVGRDRRCPDGAGVLRRASSEGACRDPESGRSVTGSGGEDWCVNCHAPAQNLTAALPAWDSRPFATASREPLRDLMSQAVLEGIGCAACHEVTGPVRPALGGYQGNPFWTSVRSGRTFSMRPEDARGRFGIANSGYRQEPSAFLALAEPDAVELVAGGVHRRMRPEQRAYLRSSEFCGACHDVRLFGSDVIGASKGEHFKRLRNAYSEWESYAALERARGRTPASCQDCHMSAFPGVCEPDPRAATSDSGCPPGTRFSPRPPGSFVTALGAASSRLKKPVFSHYFSGVDVPLAPELPTTWVDDPTLDAHGTPLGARQRRDLLLKGTVKLEAGRLRLHGSRLELPLRVENVGAGHRVPAGFSQERELWLHVKVTDRGGRVVYEAGRVDSADQDLRDKIFLRVSTTPFREDERGRPLGLFGADVKDGPDVPRWRAEAGGTRFFGRGLVNFQNGFLRCVRCIGVIAPDGSCRPGPGQGFTRADRYADADYDPDSGLCRSNLAGGEALFETYFPIGALDASRGIVKAPDAILDTRSLAPQVPVEYVHELEVDPGAAPFRVEARLLFRAFPPFLIRAFAAYEAAQARAGRRPSGPLIDERALERIDVVELERLEVVGP